MKRAAKSFIGILALAAMAAAAWIVLDPIVASDGGWSAPSPSSGQASAPRKNPNVIEADSSTREQLGLAFGKAVERQIIKPINVPGVVAFDDRRVTHLKPRTQGRVLTLAVRPGDEVESGAVLATIDASSVLDARNGLAGAKASLSEAKAALEAAKIATRRAAALLKIGGVPKAEVERRNVEEARAEAAVESAKARVDNFAAQYERLAPSRTGAPGTSEIVSPIKGVVVASDITLGEVVDTATDAFTIADPSKVLVRASLFGFDINAVKKGDAAEIDAELGGEDSFSARVLSVNAAIDPATNSAPARLEVDNRDGRLKANMFVAVKIDADFGRRGVTVPAAAVQQLESEAIAFVQTGANTFERKTLTLGLQRPDWVEIRKGVSVGDRVVTDGSFALKALLVRNLLTAAE